MSREISIKQGIDWITVLLYLIFVVCGWLSIYGASYDFDQSSIFDFENRTGKQFVWILTAFGLAGVILMIDYRIYDSIITNFIYIAVMLLLILTIVGWVVNLPFVPDIKGSRSWIVLGPISIQPAELAKVATALAVSRFIATQKKISKWQDVSILLLIVFIPFCLIILQKETGSALVFAAFFLVFYREWMSGVVLLSGVFAILLFIIIVRFGNVPLSTGGGDLGMLIAILAIFFVEFIYAFFFLKKRKEACIMLCGVFCIGIIIFLINRWVTAINYNYFGLLVLIISGIYWGIVAFVDHRSRQLRGLVLFIAAALIFCFAANYFFDSILQPHQQTRIKIVLNMEDDPSGAGYNVNQSKIAIGSGALLGKGFLNGTQTKLKYVPEQDTDFIFCTVGEEFGFVGSASILILFLIFLLRLVHIAERQRDVFNRVYGYCVVCIFFFHIMVNIGMVIGLMPVIGIPLPFFSYGGSSLWSFTILLFILLRLDSARKERLG